MCGVGHEKDGACTARLISHSLDCIPADLRPRKSLPTVCVAYLALPQFPGRSRLLSSIYLA